MITLQELSEELNKELNIGTVADFCPNGIQVEGSPNIEKIATAVTASLLTIEKAVEAGVQALIVHHGMFWNRDPYPIVGVKKKKLELLFGNKISLLAYHLPLDMHTVFGNNWKAAVDLGWTSLEPVMTPDKMPLGVKGCFSPRSVDTFKNQMETYYGHDAHCALGKKQEVATGMIISGGGYRFLDLAAAQNVDCFVTGNFDEPAWHQAYEMGVNFFAMGHSATERVGPIALGEYIQTRWHIPTVFLDVYNPF